MEDSVRPTDVAFKAMFERAYRTWAQLCSSLKEGDDQQLQLSCLRKLDNIFPHFPRLPADLLVRSPVEGIAIAGGKSSWEASKTPGDIPSFEHDLHLQMATSVPRPVSIAPTNDRPSGLCLLRKENGEDHTTILILAWTYILSARWAELLPDSTSLEYEESETPQTGSPPDEEPGSVVVDLGDTDDSACRWWAAVLAPGQGWTAQVRLHDRKALYSPWSMTLDIGCQLKLSSSSSNRSGGPSKPTPASYREAMAYLDSYVCRHGLYDQSRAALAAALFVPVATFDRCIINLPAPRLSHGASKEAGSPGQPPLAVPQDLVDRLLPLSCNARGMKSLLYSVLYEPDVPCNLSGAWVQGTLAYLEKKEPSQIVSALMMRDPAIGCLWVGATLMGVNQKSLEETSKGLWKVDLNVAALTGTVMSFMQESISPLSLGANHISKADECRMRHLCHPITGFPPVAFPPFGSTALSDTEAEVRSHVDCRISHALEFKQFTWVTKNANRQPDCTSAPVLRTKNGIEPMKEGDVPVPTEAQKRAAEVCSMNATNDVFLWLRDVIPASLPNIDAAEQRIVVDHGHTWPASERYIFEHEWVKVSHPEDVAETATAHSDVTDVTVLG